MYILIPETLLCREDPNFNHDHIDITNYHFLLG